MVVRLAIGSGADCGGCAIAILDMHEKILDVLKAVQIVYWQIAADIRTIPECDVGLYIGNIRTERNIEELKELREKCKILIAFGTCACYCGIPGIAFYFPLKSLLDKVYKETKGTVPCEIPSKNIPALERSLVPIDQVVDVDYYIPGCPAIPDVILEALSALIEGRAPKVEKFHKPICYACNRDMTKPEKPFHLLRRVGKFDEKKCFLSQGVLCLGPVTLNRCNAACTTNGTPCVGCGGPTIPDLLFANRDALERMAYILSLLYDVDIGVVRNAFYDPQHVFYAYTTTHPVLWRKACSHIPTLVEIER